VAARSKAWVFGRSLAGIVGSNSAGGRRGCLFLVSAVCCQVEVTLDCSLVQRSPTDCGERECDRDSSIIRRPWPTSDCRAGGGGGVRGTRS
jgi:hypothetical protein